MKKILLTLTLLLAVCLPGNIFAEKAIPNNNSKIEIVNSDVSVTKAVFSTFNIKDYNYFKLRNLGTYMNFSSKKFDIKYDEEKDSIEIFTNKEYSGYDSMILLEKVEGIKEALPTKQRIFIDGKEIKLNGYNIDGNNYFKLRDLASVLDFKIDYDNENKTVIINPQMSNDENKLDKFSKKLSEETSKVENKVGENVNSENIIGRENLLCYIPAKNFDRKYNVTPGYVVEIKNAKITNFKECKNVVSVPKNTALLYINYNVYNEKLIIDNDETNISQGYLKQWLKKGILVPVVRCEKTSDIDGVFNIRYITFVDTVPKNNNMTEILNIDKKKAENFFYGYYLFDAFDTEYISFTADKGDIYALAKKGENIGWSWWNFSKPKNYNEKIEHMINYALSVQGVPYKKYDCSGLVGAASDFAGFHITPATYSWLIEGSPDVKEVPMNELRRGDLLNKAGSHIMIYIGDGKVVESVPKTGVRVAPVRKAGYKVLRILDK